VTNLQRIAAMTAVLRPGVCVRGGRLELRQWRQPARHGRSAELGPTAPTILWQTGRPAIIAQEGVCEGNVLVVPRWSDFGSGGFIVGYNLTTGAEMWAKQLP
jgi:hypothetical protein